MVEPPELFRTEYDEIQNSIANELSKPKPSIAYASNTIKNIKDDIDKIGILGYKMDPKTKEATKTRENILKALNDGMIHEFDENSKSEPSKKYTDFQIFHDAFRKMKPKSAFSDPLSSRTRSKSIEEIPSKSSSSSKQSGKGINERVQLLLASNKAGNTAGKQEFEKLLNKLKKNKIISKSEYIMLLHSWKN